MKTFRGEAIGGITTFLTMAYIVVVNPSILATPGTGMSFSGVLTATVLLAFSMTLLMGIYAKLPFGVAPGMGINAFFTYTLIFHHHVSWQQALGMVFWAGVLFLVISVVPLRVILARAIPKQLRYASAAGIGLFLAFIGLKNAGIVAPDPVTFVRIGKFDGHTILTLLGLAIMLPLFQKRNPLAFLWGMGAVTIIEVARGAVAVPKDIIAMPDFNSVFLKLDIWGALKLSLLPSIIAIFFTDLFDSISTFVGVSQATGLVDKKGEPQNLSQGLLVDAWATLGAGLLGTSSGTAYIESAAGIEAGGRTGLSAVVTALCFLPCLFIGPLVAMVPSSATAPVLIIVGGLMFRSLKDISFQKVEELIPAFLTIVLIPLTFSITQGLLWGFLSHVVLFWLTGRRREISPMLHVIALVSLGLILLEQLRPN